MNTQSQKQKYKIKVENLGPIEKLDEELSHDNRILIYANNGTGKSFISRSLKLLDSDFDESDFSNIATNLLRMEATTKKGSISIFQGEKCVASVAIDGNIPSIDISRNDFIFSIFNSEYVDQEVKVAKQFEFRDAIEGEIILGSKSIEIETKEKLVSDLSIESNKKRIAKSLEYEDEKRKVLTETSVTSTLHEFKELEFENNFSDKFNNAEIDKEITLLEYENAKSSLKKYDEIDESLSCPDLMPFDFKEINLDDMEKFLLKPISLSTVGEDFKRKIEIKGEFIKSGLDVIKKTNEISCPFCEQTLEENSIDLINKYIEYFKNEEAKAKQYIADTLSIISKRKIFLENYLANAEIIISKFNKVKKNIAEFDTDFLNSEEDNIIELIQQDDELTEILNEKKNSLETPLVYKSLFLKQAEKRQKLKQDIYSIRNNNSELMNNVNRTISNSAESKRKFKRALCEKFANHFYAKNHLEFAEIENINTLLEQEKYKLSQLRKTSMDKISTEERVFETFKELMLRVFGEKYVFDRQKRTITLGKNSTSRSLDSTFSDGEKNVIGLIYFISELHLKVAEKEDYSKLFFDYR